ncbi:Hypothetical predicted protein [Octopus vulgaris]|uniref:Uncharacterized protein n=1 Tax=Octopus vulgaris TaxID=6645 RepID=A0AA36EV12_OCTVU|nr:Hypothetical predicted protein [Octopus vulgaris]
MIRVFQSMEALSNHCSSSNRQKQNDNPMQVNVRKPMSFQVQVISYHRIKLELLERCSLKPLAYHLSQSTSNTRTIPQSTI